MSDFPSLYRAQAKQVNGRTLTAYVPQVFGEESISVVDSIGSMPVDSGMGWVLFQAGNPEFPVWLGLAADTDIADLQAEIDALQAADVAFANVDVALQAADVALDARLDSLEGKTGSQFLAPDGTVLFPGYAFGSDSNTGLWRISDGLLGVSTNGVERARFTATGLAVTGTLAATGAVSTGALTVTGTLNVTGVITGNGSGLTALNASNLATGTVPNGVVSGAYTGITGLGTLGALTVTGTTTLGTVTANGTITFPTGIESIKFQAAGYIDWWNGASRIGYMQGNTTQLFINAEGNSLLIRGTGASIDNGTATYAVTGSVIGNRVVCTNANGYIFGNYINMTADVGSNAPYLAGQNGDSYLRWYTGVAVSGQIVTAWNQQAHGASWDQASFLVNPNTGTCALAFLPGGVAPQFRSPNDGVIYVRGGDGNTPYGMSGLQFINTSSRRYKQNIASWPALSLSAAIDTPLATVLQLSPVTYQQLDTAMAELPSTDRRLEALKRLNAHTYAKGYETYELPTHVCDTDPCGGTADSPCGRAMNFNKGQLGFVAEEVEAVFPEAVSYNGAAEVEGLDTMAFHALEVSAIQELTRRVAELEQRVGAA